MNRSIDKPSAKEIYEALRKQILTLELEPGTILDEFSLAHAFGVSRSPIRTAMARLLAENLLANVGSRTIVTHLIDYVTFPQYVDALDLVQRAVTRMAARLATDADLDRLRDANGHYLESMSALDPHRMSENNKRFHLSIARIAGNMFLTRHYADLLDRGQRLMHAELKMLTSKEDLVQNDDHAAIIEAIANHDEATAEEEARRHTVIFRDRFLESAAQRRTEDISVNYGNSLLVEDMQDG